MILGRLGRGYCKKNRVLEFLAKFFENFLAENISFGQEEPINVQFFRFLSAVMKVHPIPDATFEATRSVFIQIFHRCSVS